MRIRTCSEELVSGDPRKISAAAALLRWGCGLMGQIGASLVAQSGHGQAL